MRSSLRGRCILRSGAQTVKVENCRRGARESPSSLSWLRPLRIASAGDRGMTGRGSTARAARSFPFLACLLVPVVRGCVSAPEQDKAHDEEGRDRDTDADKGKRRQGEHRSGATESDCSRPFNPITAALGRFWSTDESRRGFQPGPATGRPTAGFLQLASSSHPAKLGTASR